MTDFAGTATAVTSTSTGFISQTIVGQAGETLSNGQAVYANPGSSPPAYFKCNVANATSSSVTGIALNTAAVNNPVVVAVGGDIYLTGTTLAVGDVITLASSGSANGQVAQNRGAVSAGDYSSLVGVMVGSTQCRLAVTTNNGVSHP
jgi:hypothetical protein